MTGTDAAVDAILLELLEREMQIDQLHSQEDVEIMKDLCPKLMIGGVEILEYSDAGAEAADEVMRRIRVYEAPDGIGPDVRCMRKTALEPKIVLVRAFSSCGVMWNDEQAANVTRFIGIFDLFKERICLADTLKYTNYHELQYGFYNIRHAIRRIKNLIRRGVITDYASLFINVRNMADINNNLGRDVSDVILKMYGERFESIIGPDEVFWRFGGDNFGALILQSNLDSFLTLVKGCNIKYGSGFRDVVHMSATAGIYILDENTRGLSDVIDGAASSLSIARFVKRVPYQFYDLDTIRIIERNRNYETHFEEAINAEDFLVYYQPKVNLDTFDLVGAEALCRWKHEGSLIPPEVFVPVFENSKRICDLDFYMLEHVCIDMKRWLGEGIKLVPISFNFSKKHLSNPNLVRDMLDVIDRYDIPHDLLTAEFTETTSYNDMKRLHEVIIELKQSGIRTSVDDFGVGSSSLGLILEVPFDELKIDKSILDLSGDDYDKRVILFNHVISLAREFGMSTIAEGVEEPEQIQLLRDYKCNVAQGFYFDKPLYKSVFHERLLSRHYNIL